MLFKNLCILVLWKKVASTSEGLITSHAPTQPEHSLSQTVSRITCVSTHTLGNCWSGYDSIYKFQLNFLLQKNPLLSNYLLLACYPEFFIISIQPILWTIPTAIISSLDLCQISFSGASEELIGIQETPFLCYHQTKVEVHAWTVADNFCDYHKFYSFQILRNMRSWHSVYMSSTSVCSLVIFVVVILTIFTFSYHKHVNFHSSYWYDLDNDIKTIENDWTVKVVVKYGYWKTTCGCYHWTILWLWPGPCSTPTLSRWVDLAGVFLYRQKGRLLWAWHLIHSRPLMPKLPDYSGDNSLPKTLQKIFEAEMLIPKFTKKLSSYIFTIHSLLLVCYCR